MNKGSNLMSIKMLTCNSVFFFLLEEHNPVLVTDEFKFYNNWIWKIYLLIWILVVDYLKQNEI